MIWLIIIIIITIIIIIIKITNCLQVKSLHEQKTEIQMKNSSTKTSLERTSETKLSLFSGVSDFRLWVGFCCKVNLFSILNLILGGEEGKTLVSSSRIICRWLDPDMIPTRCYFD